MKRNGFTLIEIMIVVAIVSILAAVAIPMYQTYVIRAKITEALTAAGSTKTYVAIYHAEAGTLPQNTAQLGITEDVNWNYVRKIEVQADGHIVVTVRKEALQAAADATFVMIPTDTNGSLSWSCQPPGSIEHKYLPISCRPDA